MRIAYLDCFAGISGDMLLGALLDVGLDPRVLQDATAALNLGASLTVEKVDRSGISATKVHVMDGVKLAEAAAAHGHQHDEHGHQHHHGRHLSAIKKVIESSSLPTEVKVKAVETFELLGASEARIHNVPVEKIHFHEVGAVDAMVDIVAATAGLHALGVEQWFSSPLNVGGGMIDCAHGRFPVPAPATADLLRDVPTYSQHVDEELVTPTGAAIVRALDPTFGPQPAMRVQKIGYGAGTRNPKGFPNVLRLSIGESAGAGYGSVAVLETALDDLSPQILAHVAERALALGALDVMSTPVVMKKGRPGTLLTVLAEDAQVAALEDLLLRETSTLGIRIHHERRACLERSHTAVATPYGEIRIKLGSRSGEVLNAAPEFEDCRAAAAQHGVPVKQVQQAAIAAYLGAQEGTQSR
ncbi:nickel pincer cofactor biosynthesis protein LarC [Edaphobacter sp.]|uniref:nickel pincer cofactor biosynthesis protein LarC n=1 Tax=Edaphobacter sp. TaxID=1934404 RepID=UPI002DB5596B|nr:nickel pincer cofactor biosynthesis protein LarC [Edaphobacter sp.]HEU5339700.1 nickel pincer cofactor biosynthesis protein LarC [Edaphobacter sp.]